MSSINLHWNSSLTKVEATACQFTTFFSIRLWFNDYTHNDTISIMCHDKQHAVDMLEAMIKAVEEHDYYYESVGDVLAEIEDDKKPVESVGLTD